MYKVYAKKLSRYQAAVVFMAKHMKAKTFDGTSLRGALDANTDLSIVQFILRGKPASKFITSSKVNINYITVFKDGVNTIPDSLFNLFVKSDIAFSGNDVYIFLKGEESFDLYNAFVKMKSINSMLYDGEGSVLTKIIRKLENENYLRHVSDSRSKIYAKEAFVDGNTSIATRQYLFSITRDLDNLEVVFADRFYVDFNDIVCDGVLYPLDVAEENILMKLIKNDIVSKAIEHSLISNPEYKAIIETKVKKLLYKQKR